MLPSYKTAPRLLHSIYYHNQRKKDSGPGFLRISSDCQHSYATRHYQSELLNPGHEQPGDHQWRVAATCQLCLARLDVKVVRSTDSVPCPTSEFPVHLFSEIKRNGTSDDELEFVCTAPACGCYATIRFKGPVLGDSDLQLLALQVSRAEKHEAERNTGVESKRLTLFRNFRTFRTYINDALSREEPKRILITNPRFLEVFGPGQAAENLLKRLGFTVDFSSPNPAWHLPSPRSSEEKNELQDLAEELTILIRRRPRVEHAPGSEFSFGPPPEACRNDLEAMLGTSNYPRYSSVQQNLSSREQHDQDSSYSRLGIMPDFSDSMVLWTYKRLVSITDHESHPHLFQALKDIALIRSSEHLNIEVGTLESQGVKTADEIDKAFLVLGVDPSHVNVINDMSILGAYRSRFVDVSNNEQNRMRSALRVVAEYKNSHSLLQEASGSGYFFSGSNTVVSLTTHKAIETYQQALDWLGAPDSQTDDDFIFSLMAIKIEESAQNKTLAHRAVEIIADARESDRLRTLLAGNEPTRQKLTLSGAYKMLGCQDSSAIDDSLLIDSYSVGIIDNPSQKEVLREALAIIANHRKNVMLSTFLQSEELTIMKPGYHSNLHDPRGLKNIGNTCYLNSLLQYLFTIKPLREITSNFQKYRQQVSSDLTTVKKVSNIEVRANAILRAQDFVEELQRLFSKLVTATEPFVTPEDNLARLTLINVVNESVRRRSTVSGSKIHVITDQRAEGHLERQGLQESGVNATMPNTCALSEQSEVAEVAQVMDQDREASLPARTQATLSNQPNESNENDQIINECDKMLVDSAAPLNSEYSRLQTHRAEYEEFARQQDVREVIQNVLGQLRWAVKPEGEESDGEQIDPISRLFYGKENYVTVNELREESKIQPFFDIWVYFISGSCDIYTALDGTFDRDVIEGFEDGSPRNFQYRSIISIPPILQISVSRVNFDTETARTYKIEDQLRLHEVICMDRYVADPIILEKRRLSWSLKAELRRLKTRREHITKTGLQLDLADVIKKTSDYLANLTQNANGFGLNGLKLDSSVFDTLDMAVQDIRSEIEMIDANILAIETRISNLFEKTGQLMYRLHAVFVHRGNSRAGHWFIYLYDSESKAWRNYNDETVVLVSDTKTIFEPLALRDGTSSFVVYIRDSLLNDTIETVYRRPREPELVNPFIPYAGFKPPYS